MIKINLLPPVQRKAFWLSNRFIVTVATLFFICLGLVWGYMAYIEQQREAELRQVRQQFELLRPTLAQMQVAGLKQGAISSRQTVLLTLTKERPPIYSAFAQLAAIIPEGVWLTEISSDKTTIKVSGMAKSYPQVADFLQKVQTDPVFTDFSLLKTEQAQTTAKFEFTVKFKGM